MLSVESHSGLHLRALRSAPELKSRIGCLTDVPPRHPYNGISVIISYATEGKKTQKNLIGDLA